MMVRPEMVRALREQYEATIKILLINLGVAVTPHTMAVVADFLQKELDLV